MKELEESSRYPVIWKGYVMKQGGRVKSWKRRWMIIVNGRMFYFTNADMVECKGCLPLVNSRVSTGRLEPRVGGEAEQFVAHFIVETSFRAMHMAVQSAAERDVVVAKISGTISTQNYIQECRMLRHKPLDCMVDLLLHGSSGSSDELRVESGEALDPIGLQTIARQLPLLPSVTSLILNGVGLDSASCGLLRDVMVTRPTLIRMDLGHNSISDSGVDLLAAGALCSMGIQEISLARNTLTDAAGPILGNLLRMDPGLLVLDLSHNAIGPAGAEIVAALADNMTLTKLDLTGNPIGDDVATTLSEVMTRNSTLSEIHLGFTGITPRGVRTIAEGLPYSKSLTTLDLSGASFDADAACDLSDTISFAEALTRVDLSRVTGLEDPDVMESIGDCVAGGAAGLKLRGLVLSVPPTRAKSRPLPAPPQVPMR